MHCCCWVLGPHNVDVGFHIHVGGEYYVFNYSGWLRCFCCIMGWRPRRWYGTTRVPPPLPRRRGVSWVNCQTLYLGLICYWAKQLALGLWPVQNSSPPKSWLLIKSDDFRLSGGTDRGGLMKDFKTYPDVVDNAKACSLFVLKPLWNPGDRVMLVCHEMLCRFHNERTEWIEDVKLPQNLSHWRLCWIGITVPFTRVCPSEPRISSLDVIIWTSCP